MTREKAKILVSACLAGIPCRYDGNHQARDFIQKMVQEGRALPVCPEELGNLPTPRAPAENFQGKFLTTHGDDVTLNYREGAKRALELALENNCQEAYLKSQSPMCGVGSIYDGTFSHTLIEGDGAFTQLLKSQKIKVNKVD